MDRLYKRSKLPRRNGDELVSCASVKLVKMSMEMRSKAVDFGEFGDNDAAAPVPADDDDIII